MILIHSRRLSQTPACEYYGLVDYPRHEGESEYSYYFRMRARALSDDDASVNCPDCKLIIRR